MISSNFNIPSKIIKLNYPHISAIPFGGFDAYNLLRSLNIIFPQIIINVILYVGHKHKDVKE